MGDPSGQTEAAPGVMGVPAGQESIERKLQAGHGFVRVLASRVSSCRKCPRRTRTYNPLIKSQVRVDLVNYFELSSYGGILPLAAFQGFSGFPLFFEGFIGILCTCKGTSILSLPCRWSPRIPLVF